MAENWKVRAEKAEAEVARLTASDYYWAERADKAEAELAAAHGELHKTNALMLTYKAELAAERGQVTFWHNKAIENEEKKRAEALAALSPKAEESVDLTNDIRSGRITFGG